MNKDWYKSKTIWVAIVTAVLSVATTAGYVVPTEVYGVLGALGLYAQK